MSEEQKESDLEESGVVSEPEPCGFIMPEPKPNGWRRLAGFLRGVLIIGVILGCLALPLIWLFLPKQYETTAAVRVKPVIQSFLFSDAESDQPMFGYERFRQTQAELMTSQTVLVEISNQLAKNNLSMFETIPDRFGELVREVWQRKDLSLLFRKMMDPEDRLRQLIRDGNLTIKPLENTELIRIVMIWNNPNEASFLVNTLLKSYMTKVVEPMERSQNQKILDLSMERDNIYKQYIDIQRTIQTIIARYGTADLDKALEQLMEKIVSVSHQISALERENQDLETELSQPEPDAGVVTDAKSWPAMKALRDYIASDYRYQLLTKRQVELELEMVEQATTQSGQNPELERYRRLTEFIGQKLDARGQLLVQEFTDLSQAMTNAQADPTGVIKKEIARRDIGKKIISNQRSIDTFKEELDHLHMAYKDLGSDRLEMIRLRDQGELTKQIYDVVALRVNQLMIEDSRRPNRIEIGYMATTSNLPARRGWIMFWLAGGMVVAIVLIVVLGKVRRGAPCGTV